ncbi:MAG TPA: hypothetical protein VGQ83_14285 [Polyangia bacterium]
MRMLRLAVLVVLVGSGGFASAQSVYGDGDLDDGPYADSPVFREPAAPPPPAQARAQQRPASPYELLDEPAGAPPAAGAPAEPGQQWRYNGPHAVNAEYGQGWCNVTGAHVHEYPPFDDRLFQENTGGYDFLGDPTDFGYSGDAYWYNGAHPIATGWGTGWCFYASPHRHLYRPWGSYFSSCGPYSCYYGPFDAYYWYYRPYWTAYWGAYYPRYYHHGAYYRTHTPASPGRWGNVRPGSGHYGTPGSRTGTPGGRVGTPAGRPGGYARPVQALPKLTRPTTLQGRLSGSPYHRMAPTPMPRYTGPRTYPGARTYTVPRGASPYQRFGGGAPAPRFGGGFGGGTPHYSAPRPAAPSYSAPRPSAPSGGGLRGGFHGGGRRR